MRPTGEIRMALMEAARTLARPDHGPTLSELVQAAQVGYDAGLHTVKNMRRAGELVKIGERRVDYRNKPVAEWAPADLVPAAAAGHAELAAAMSFWER